MQALPGQRANHRSLGTCNSAHFKGITLISPILPGAVLGQKGPIIVRLAGGDNDVMAAQALRYRVFYEELGAKPGREIMQNRRDSDAFDEICDHLLVVETAKAGDNPANTGVRDGEVVGTYRLLRQEIAEKTLGFYTQDEFDIATLIDRKPELRFLELGRSCVLKPYRTKPIVELLWQGIWHYVRAHRLDVMLGCASMVGTNIEALVLPLSFLHHHFRAPDEWRVYAQPDRCAQVAYLTPDRLETKAAMRALPPLIKGYLRLGAYIGDGAVTDKQFNTTDVLIVLPVPSISSRYRSYFAKSDG